MTDRPPQPHYDTPHNPGQLHELRPQAPMPPGVPSGTLSYATSYGMFRPGLLTALAICSIIFGSLGVLFNLASVSRAAIVLIFDTEEYAPLLDGTAADTTPAGAISTQEADVIAAALARHQPLTPDEQRRLAEALPRVESPLAPPLPGEPWTPEHVDMQLSNSFMHGGSGEGEVEGGGEEEAADPDEEPEREVHFEFGGNGDLWIWPDRIEFSALPMEGGYVTSTVWPDGGIEVDDQRVADPAWLMPLLWAMLLSYAVAMGLAVVLIVAGIQTLRDRPGAGQLHRAWAWARLAMAGVMTLLTLWIIWMAQQDIEQLGAGTWWAVAAVVVIFGLVSSAYPIAVLLVLRTRRVREWYELGVRQAATA